MRESGLGYEEGTEDVDAVLKLVLVDRHCGQVNMEFSIGVVIVRLPRQFESFNSAL